MKKITRKQIRRSVASSTAIETGEAIEDIEKLLEEREMSKLREEARGRPCTMRLSDQCTGGGEDTVLAHCPSVDKCMGRKSPDWWGAHLCYNCHLDSESINNKYTREEILEGWLRAIYETQKTLVDEGLIKLPPDANKTYNRQRRNF